MARPSVTYDGLHDTRMSTASHLSNPRCSKQPLPLYFRQGRHLLPTFCTSTSIVNNSGYLFRLFHSRTKSASLVSHMYVGGWLLCCRQPRYLQDPWQHVHSGPDQDDIFSTRTWLTAAAVDNCGEQPHQLFWRRRERSSADGQRNRSKYAALDDDHA